VNAKSPPATLPRASLDFIAQRGPRELVFAPPQSVFPGVRSYLNLPFSLTAGYRMLRLDLHVPENAKGPLPVVIYASGGGWLLVAKNDGPWKFLLSEGFAVVSIEYRLSGEARFPAALHDVKTAIRWVRAHAETYGLDPARVAGWGSSAGAYLFSMAAVTQDRPEFEGDGEHLDQSSRVASVIDHYGPSDLAAAAEDTNHLPGAMELMGTETSPETRLLGYVPASDPASAAKASVLSYVGPQTPPFLILHGDADTRLGIGQSRRLHEALQAQGSDTTFIVIPGANHGTPEFYAAEANTAALEFLRRTLDIRP
jgi:acetyl esterase/lipase